MSGILHATLMVVLKGRCSMLRGGCWGAGQGGHFVMTGSVKGHLHNLARAALIGRYPILLQASYLCTL